jgi:hypothetical protein
MELGIDFLAGKASVAGIALFSPSFKAVQGLCKLESHPSLSYSLISKKEVAMHDPVVDDGSSKQFDRFLVADDIFKRHIFNQGFKDSKVLGVK